MITKQLQFDPHKHRIMVGRIVPDVFIEGDFLRRISAF